MGLSVSFGGNANPLRWHGGKKSLSMLCIAPICLETHEFRDKVHKLQQAEWKATTKSDDDPL